MRDLAEFMQPDLVLPIRGREYVVTCTAWQGLHLYHLLTTSPTLSDEQEQTEILQMLGDTHQRMVDDGLPWAVIVHAARAAMLHYGHSESAGVLVWQGGGLPGNPIPPPPGRTVVGEKLRTMIRPRERMGRMIRAVANTTP